ncbi:MAG: hypothetical protein HRU29_01100 [Rhizobiales bacterium]|nr:hypothetical protein [Hyphomicrobiales bacterium]NRB12969.1 hypothetical protein [Hyphomicrobiales bacterium]
MSLNLQLVNDNVTGSWAIFLRRSFALKYFKVDSNNFIWSFSVVLFLIIFQLYVMPFEDEIFDKEVAAGLTSPNVVYKLIVLIINWFSWPLVAYVICRLMAIEAHFIRYVIVENWTGLITQTLAVVPIMMYQVGVASGMAITAMFFVSLIILLYKWRVAKVALGTTSLNASIILFIDVAYSIIVSYFLSLLFV